ncbi:hypothetical protein CGC21_0960 [Leishmania donovani]|uniref:Uncharacterized protein n=1 Tax=Leishmania donovani TaxID=5661 RepID=A0A504Y453_LEIDO|nr:hypothetical protein CGC21_0960 [Leishmania donovani]
MLEGDATSAQLCRDPSGRFQQPPTPDKLESPERAQRATAFQKNAPRCATGTWRSFIELAAQGCPRRSKLASTPPPPVVSINAQPHSRHPHLVARDSLVPESKSSVEVFARQLYLEEQACRATRLSPSNPSSRSAVEPLVSRLRGHRISRSRPANKLLPQHTAVNRYLALVEYLEMLGEATLPGPSHSPQVAF